jgi:hypothetical protein
MHGDPQIEFRELPMAEDTSDSSGCPVMMVTERCGRPLHDAPEGIDKRPVCLMHSRDLRKQEGTLLKSFMQEFDTILQAAGDGEATFAWFVFPGLDFRHRQVQAGCGFIGTTFTQDAVFEGTTFAQGATFDLATFIENAYFNDATFTQNAVFSYATFMQNASFFRTNFEQFAVFSSATFTQDAYFHSTTFTDEADFGNATFTQKLSFESATFTWVVNFGEALFMQNADFNRATFMQSVIFSGATFTCEAAFKETTFHGFANWTASRFLGSSDFRTTKFLQKSVDWPSAVFSLASLAKPREIVFDDVDLSRSHFNNCDVSEVLFTSKVNWGKKDGRKAVVFDETIPLDQYFAANLNRNGERDHRAVAQLYQQLKKNYDARLDYWTANEFHFGEMEMQRLALPTAGPFLNIRRWWHPRLSFVAWYKYGSDYGNSYTKPVWWLVATLLVFMLFFPLAGLQHIDPKWTETYVSVWRWAGGSIGHRLWSEVGLVAKSLLTAIDTATFQKSPEYVPAYPWGRALAILEALLTSTVFALFLLAMRRQFRR